MTKAQRDIFQYALAGILVLGEFAVIGLLIWVWGWRTVSLDPAMVNLIYGMVLGYHSAFMIVVGYFFASSVGSADKNEMLSNQMSKP